MYKVKYNINEYIIKKYVISESGNDKGLYVLIKYNFKDVVKVLKGKLNNSSGENFNTLRKQSGSYIIPLKGKLIEALYGE